MAFYKLARNEGEWNGTNFYFEIDDSKNELEKMNILLLFLEKNQIQLNKTIKIVTLMEDKLSSAAKKIIGYNKPLINEIQKRIQD